MLYMNVVLHNRACILPVVLKTAGYNILFTLFDHILVFLSCHYKVIHFSHGRRSSFLTCELLKSLLMVSIRLFFGRHFFSHQSGPLA